MNEYLSLPIIIMQNGLNFSVITEEPRSSPDLTRLGICTGRISLFCLYGIVIT